MAKTKLITCDYIYLIISYISSVLVGFLISRAGASDSEKHHCRNYLSSGLPALTRVILQLHLVFSCSVPSTRTNADEKHSLQFPARSQPITRDHAGAASVPEYLLAGTAIYPRQRG